MHAVRVIVPSDECLTEPRSRADEGDDTTLVGLCRLQCDEIARAHALHAMSHGVEVVDDLRA